jgi:hypothetical protein
MRLMTPINSIIYTDNPMIYHKYIDSLKRSVWENLKVGKYLLVALKDKTTIIKDLKNEKVGFIKHFITVPNTPFTNWSYSKDTSASGNRLLMGYEGNGSISSRPKITLKDKANIISTIQSSSKRLASDLVQNLSKQTL